MQKIYKRYLLTLFVCFIAANAIAQDTIPDNEIDTIPVTSVDADLMNIYKGAPKKYKVKAVKVTGNTYFDQNLLLSIVNINVGDEIMIPGGDNFAKAINNIWKQNYFSNAEIFITELEGNEISLEVVVTERPRLSNFDFSCDTKKSEKEELSGRIGLIKGRIVTENMKRTATDIIKKFYAEKGFRSVQVNITETRDPNIANALTIDICVLKGEKQKISSIEFSGNTIDQSKLKKQLKGTKEMSRLTLYPPKDTTEFAPSRYNFRQYLKDAGYLSYSKTKRVLDPYVRIKPFVGAKFNQQKFNEDLESVVDYYNGKGHRDAAIVDTSVKLNSDGNLNIHIKVDEGKQYYFGNITWRGNTKYNDSTLSAIMGIKKGDIYNVEVLNKKLGKSADPDGGDISGLYQDDGYLFFRTEAVETAVYNDTIDHEIRITEGPQAVWKNIKITGNDKTKEYVIRRELRTLPGEKFSRTDLVRSQRELSQLNYFNPEKINPQIVPNPEDGTVDVTWELEEKSSDQLELSAGFGGGIGLTGTLGVSFNNFSLKNIFKKGSWDPLPVGDGQRLSIRVQSNGRAYNSKNISFTEPWLGGKRRNSFTVSLYDTKYANAYDPSTGTYTRSAANNSYIRTSGVSVGLGKQLRWPDDYFSMMYSLSYTNYKLKNYPIDSRNLPGFENGNSHNVNLRIALQRSSIDNPQFTRSGSSFLLSVQATPPWSSLRGGKVNAKNPYELVEYHKWRYTGEWFTPIGKPHGAEKNKQFVLRAAVKYGFMGRYNNNLQISPFERFQVGDAGMSNNFALLGFDIISHRGYPVYENSDPRINPDQQGASQYFTIFNKYTLEMRYPFSLNPSSTIYGLTFFEAANGWYNFKDYNPFKLRRSVGVGMRFFLPMFGLLGFDYGVGLDRYGPNTKLKDAARFTFMLGFEPE